jgi:hypothetical protein
VTGLKAHTDVIDLQLVPQQHSMSATPSGHPTDCVLQLPDWNSPPGFSKAVGNHRLMIKMVLSVDFAELASDLLIRFTRDQKLRETDSLVVYSSLGGPHACS